MLTDRVAVFISKMAWLATWKHMNNVCFRLSF